MRYAISYVSTAALNISPGDIKDLLKKIAEDNNAQKFTGILLSSETNFFELIEGEKEQVINLYARIAKDTRHTNLIKIYEKAVFLPAYDGFTCEVITDKTRHDSSNLKGYLHYIEVLDPTAQKAVKRVIEAILL